MCVWCVYGGEGLPRDRLPHDPNTSFVFPACLKDSLMEHIDWEAADYLPEVVKSQFNKRAVVPLRTTGDGNCLLNAVSRAIFGVEVYWELLRALVVEELKNNFDWYKESTEIEKDEWDKALAEATKSGNYLNFQHVFALSNVIRRPIILYASDNDIARYGTGENGCAATFVPGRFSASSSVASSPVYLSWGSGRKNHFVPLIGVEGQAFPSLPVFQVAFPSRVPQTEMMNYINQHEKPKEPPIMDRMRREASDVTNDHYTSAEEMILSMFARSSSNRNNELASSKSQKRFKDDEDDWTEFGSSEGKVVELVQTPDGHNLLISRPADTELHYIDGKIYAKRKTLTESDDGMASSLSNEDMLEYYDRIFKIKYEEDSFVTIGHRKGDSVYETLDRIITENPQLEAHRNKIATFLTQNIPYQETSPLPTRTVPQKQPVLYTRLNNKPDPTADFENLIQKILEFNRSQQVEWSMYVLNAQEEGYLREIVQLLIKNPYGSASFAKTSFKPEHFMTLRKLINWRKEIVFPVLDLLRLVVLYPAAADHYSQHLEVLKVVLALASDSSNNKILQMLTLKFLSNMFANKNTTQIAVKHSMRVISAILPAAASQDKFVHSCLAANLFNYSTALCDTFASKRKPHLCQVICQVIRRGFQETEKILLQSIGNLLWKDKYIKEVVAMNLLTVVLIKFQKRGNLTAEVKEVLEDIHYLLSH
eukprot:TRINITY_DN7357_c0_g1_i1.p1 TRINITY_DN7357_c0_g1~~TRINITY_DN7357_c0_g1_i1.p1  ORF type:complete len:707 (+),score=140.41 TRINITY_DN7357_c0_g1_i1:242-2362(+)